MYVSECWTRLIICIMCKKWTKWTSIKSHRTYSSFMSFPFPLLCVLACLFICSLNLFVRSFGRCLFACLVRFHSFTHATATHTERVPSYLSPPLLSSGMFYSLFFMFIGALCCRRRRCCCFFSLTLNHHWINFLPAKRFYNLYLDRMESPFQFILYCNRIVLHS